MTYTGLSDTALLEQLNADARELIRSALNFEMPNERIFDAANAAVDILDELAGYTSIDAEDEQYVCRLFLNFFAEYPELNDLEQQATLTATLYDRNYGGPEEGGWFYDTEMPVDGRKAIHGDLVTLGKRVTRMRCLTESLVNRHRREVDSVLSEGRFSYVLTFREFEGTPSNRPRYE